MPRGSEPSFPNEVLPHKSAPPFYTGKRRQERASTGLGPQRHAVTACVLQVCVGVCQTHLRSSPSCPGEASLT